MATAHTFHIPVMGIGFTIDTPLKVAQYGMDSVVSICDDILLERMREMYSRKYGLSYSEISSKMEDFRARRITSYLNMLNTLVNNKFGDFIKAASQKKDGLDKYLGMLPDASKIKSEFKKLKDRRLSLDEMRDWLKNRLTPGSIDVNIMTKVDKANYRNQEKLPVAYNDAHAALRGFANSDLESAVVFSAGMNPRLYSYLAQFDDFFPDESGQLKKKIILKVSDFRSALVQGKFLAKKGLWVSEYRVESGLNCGGHAFAADGNLLGPILKEFKEKRDSLVQTVFPIMTRALAQNDRQIPQQPPSLKITAQGGVGTAEEHRFLLEHYGVDSVGWGTPFLLVPEATTVDAATMDELVQAREEDLYLSDISPLGVPFNNLRGNTKDLEKLSWMLEGKAGSPCPKKFLALDASLTEKPVCTASRQYQRLKIDQLEGQSLTAEQYRRAQEKVTAKACICVGLGTSALLARDMDVSKEGSGVSICPGPNMAYFSKVASLREMADHIYGRENLIERTDRPHMFVKELNLYVDFLEKKIEEARGAMTERVEKHLTGFARKLSEGVAYYQSLFSQTKDTFEEVRDRALRQLEDSGEVLEALRLRIKGQTVGED